MCGICGQLNLDGSQPADRQVIRRMTGALAHRGPDDEGYYFSGPVGLGFRRLAIIDLQTGQQPMSDAQGRVWVVFNGEIFNFKEVRSALESKGHRFRTRSDTEVIVLGYKEWGIDVLQRLNGMFGLAIWDEKRKQMMIARDRMGIKLVYTRLAGGSFYFSSELRPLLLAGAGREVDPEAVNLFLRYRYTPSPLTLFRGIEKLPPGFRMIIKDGRISRERWWKFKPSPFDPLPDRRTAREELFELYKRAVGRHLISDVPVGLLLSGGVDSGLLLALMNLHGSSWKTFSVGYGAAYHEDELDDARSTAELFSAQNSQILIDRQVFERSLPGIISALEEPVATSSIVPMFHLCQRAAREVKTALIGQGPDELFGGYLRHFGVQLGSWWRSLPGWLRAPVKGALSALPTAEYVRRGLYSLEAEPRMKRYQQVLSILPAEAVDGLFYPGVVRENTGDRILDFWSDSEQLIEHTDELGGLQFLEIRSSLPDELLMYADKLSMANSLELRVPYLDQEIVEYAERLPSSYKIHHGRGKWLHRQVCQAALPREILARRKRGFAMNVVDGWFHDTLGSRLRDVLLDNQSLMYAYLSPQAVGELLDQHTAGRRNNYKILFSLVVLEEWLRVFNN